MVLLIIIPFLNGYFIGNIPRPYPLVICYIAMEKSLCCMGKSTISMAIFNSYVKLPEGMVLRLYWDCKGSYLVMVCTGNIW